MNLLLKKPTLNSVGLPNVLEEATRVVACLKDYVHIIVVKLIEVTLSSTKK